MKRRTLLAGLALPLVGGTAVVARRFESRGDNESRREGEFSIQTEPPITGHRFELVGAKERFSDGSDDPENRFANHATVEFDSAGNRVRVLGRVLSGGRSCRETKLKTLRYDDSSETLTVVVFDDIVRHDACTKEIAIVPYTVTVNFESNLPARVVVEHVKDGMGVVYEKTFGNGSRN